ncbi:MAG TPA: hypothetical protein VK654_04555 [Nitrospirota bacterium]|nr:hypothetical protein [Nitrospirota bacterium]
MRTLLLISLLFLSGCDLFSDNPLSDPAKESIDSSIIGTWTWYEEGDWGFVHIGTDAAQKQLKITMVEFKAGGKMDTTEFTGHTTKLASHSFLNLRWTRPEDMEKGYFFMEYRIGTNTLEGAFLATEIFEKAIRAGTLKGEIISQGLARKVLVHAGQEDLRRFVTQNLASLTTNTFRLKKLSLAK